MGALAYYITNMLQMLHINRKKLTKKYSPVKALLVFGYPSSVKLPGTYEGNAAYMPRAGYEKDEIYVDLPDLAGELNNRWMKVMASK